MKQKITFVLLWLMMISSYNIYGQREKGKGQRMNTGFEYQDCGCLGSFGLTIYDGLVSPYGGNAVPNGDRATKGAVTVANLNDTNGDKIPDNMLDNGSGTPNGFNEIDLMRLDINLTGVFTEQCATFKLKYKGKIKFWQLPTKQISAPTEYEIANMAAVTTVWVEAYDVSTKVRDIEIEAIVEWEVNGMIMTKMYDMVTATAIWVQPLNNGNNGKYTSRSSSPNPSSIGLDESCLAHLIDKVFISTDGTKFGLGKNTEYMEPPIGGPCGINGWGSSSCNIYDPLYIGKDGSYGGRILIGFEILPLDLKNHISTLGIKFNITRRISKQDREFRYGNKTWGAFATTNFPNFVDQSNDDLDDFDEDNNPITTGKLFSFDNPSNAHYGNTYFGAGFAFNSRDLMFQEYVITSINGANLNGQGIKGSRVSPFIPWELNYSLKSTEISPYDVNHCHQYMSEFSGLKNVSAPRKMSLSSTSKGEFSAFALPQSTNSSYILTYQQINNSWNVVRNGITGMVSLGIFFPTNTNPNKWLINDADRLILSIKEDTSFPFQNNDQYMFSILNGVPTYEFK